MNNHWLHKRQTDLQEYVNEIVKWIDDTIPEWLHEKILGYIEYEIDRAGGDFSAEEVIPLLAEHLHQPRLL